MVFVMFLSMFLFRFCFRFFVSCFCQISGSSEYHPLTIKEINKPKLLTVLKVKDSEKALAHSCPVFLKLILKLVQVSSTGQTFFFIFIDLLQQVEKLILLFDTETDF